MSAGAYLLVRFSDREKLIPAIQSVGNAEQVDQWDAIDGDYNLVLKLKDNDAQFVKTVKALDGYRDSMICDIGKDNDTRTGSADDLFSGYLFIETTDGDREAVQKALSANEAVSFCSPCEGGFDLVAQVKGERFDAIDRLVEDNFRVLDGVLRIKQYHVIYLDKM